VYTTYFGLREIPFSITPDPAYLYMSPRHQEALGHLLYGTGQYGGFVQLTGEVGTGKTTIVRTLLSQKLDGVDVAMILNPRQNEQEFVASICDELNVPYEKPATLKMLVDALNAHLLEAHADGRRTVVIIDEAQNLQPEVLEQVRLLTNLETHKEKLLRIMLVGQPELADLLSRPDLRQLAQRITARFHLTPLEPQETAEYIAHRLTVAGGSRDLFTPQAMQRLHAHAGGIPRLINVLCDRALLGAYGAGLKQVTPELADQAAQEVSGHGTPTRARRFAWGDAAIVLVILGIGGWWLWHTLYESPAATTAAAVEPVAATPTPVVVEPVPPAPDPAGMDMTLNRLLQVPQPLPVVLSKLVRIWGAQPEIMSGETLCAALSREKIECFKTLGQWKDLRQLNRPAILTLTSGRGGVQHVLLRELGSDYAVLDTAEGPRRLPLDQLDLVWNGEFLLLWQREPDDALIGPQSRGPAVVWLRQQLAGAEGRALTPPVSGIFDEELQNALVRFQAAQGLDADGLAGARTLIALSNLRLPPGTPTLTGTP
jgi:general secretion pathway protein A